MSIAKYSLNRVAPCADYGKITVEGEFEILDEKKFFENLNNLIPNINNVNSGQILIGKTDDFEIYIYDNKKFVVSKLKDEKTVINFLNKLID